MGWSYPWDSKKEGTFLIDIADVHSELNLPYWQDNVNFSGHLSGTTSSWKAKI